jgi:hypothetical protein
VGALLAVGGGLGLVMERLDADGRLRARVAVVATLAALVLAGAIRSAGRQPVWRSEAEFFSRMETDGPTTYRGHLVASVYYSRAGRYGDAERAARRGLALYQGDPQLYEQLGQVLRVEKRCGEAIPVLADGVRRFPERTVARARLVECALAVGDSARAITVAEEAVRLGQPEFGRTVRRLRGDSIRDGIPETPPPRSLRP